MLARCPERSLTSEIRTMRYDVQRRSFGSDADELHSHAVPQRF